MADEPSRIRHRTDHRRRRASEYPHPGEALDAIAKGFRAIIDGKALPPETVEWVEACESVKATYPKEPKPDTED